MSDDNQLPVVIDFEGCYCGSSDFIIKELAIFNQDIWVTSFPPPEHLNILSPIQPKTCLDRTQDTLFGIDFYIQNRTNYDPERIVACFNAQNRTSTLYSKGLTKCNYLSSLFCRPVHNLEDYIDSDQSSAQLAEIQFVQNEGQLHCSRCSPRDLLLKYCVLRKTIIFTQWLHNCIIYSEDLDEDSEEVEAIWSQHFKSINTLIEGFDAICKIESERRNVEKVSRTTAAIEH